MTENPEHRRTKRRALAVTFLAAVATLALAGVALAAVGSVAVHARMRPPVRESFTLAPGVRLTTIRYPDIPQEVRIVRIRQGAGSVVDLFTPTPSYPGYRRPSGMGILGGALAIVNGDFAAPDGRPKHLSIVDGEIWTSGIQQSSVFALSGDGSRAYAGRPDLVLTGSHQGATFSIAQMNAGDPTAPGIAAFSQRGGRAERPSGSASPRPSDPRYCAARLIPTGDFRWSGTGNAGVARSYVVEAQPEPCPKTPIAIGSDPGALVLTGRGGRPGGEEVKALGRDDRIRVAWRIRGWPGVVDVIGSQPVIVKQGRNVGRGFHPGASYFFNHNPRTALGAGIGCADARPATICSIFILTVDGRAENRWSKGMRLPVLANELIRAGAHSAVNIDGGGGSVMWVAERSPAYCETAVPQGGCLVTRPSDHGNERVAVVSVGVKPAPDTGEPTRIIRG